MRSLMALSLLALAGTFGGTPATADNQLDVQSIDLDKLTYNNHPLWPGVRAAFVAGSFDEPGLYGTHAWMEAGSIVPPHTHPDPRITVVTHGTMYVGIGETYDEDALVAYPEGSIFIIPAGAPHFMLAQDGDTAVLDSGAGPSGIDILQD